MEISIFDYIKKMSDDDLSKIVAFTQTEQNKRKVQKEEAEQKRYLFYGDWTWSCWATNEEEAKIKFEDEAYSDDLYIDYDHVQIEVQDY